MPLKLIMKLNNKLKLKPIFFSDIPFLIISGLDPERINKQYIQSEYKKQFIVAPMRYFNKITRKLSRVIWLNRKRAGYIGLNPLSGNIEYYLQPWARGGNGSMAIERYLREVMPFGITKYVFMIAGNDKSVRVFRKVLNRLKLVDGIDFEYFEYSKGTGFKIHPDTKSLD